MYAIQVQRVLRAWSDPSVAVFLYSDGVVKLGWGEEKLLFPFEPSYFEDLGHVHISVSYGDDFTIIMEEPGLARIATYKAEGHHWSVTNLRFEMTASAFSVEVFARGTDTVWLAVTQHDFVWAATILSLPQVTELASLCKEVAEGTVRPFQCLHFTRDEVFVLGFGTDHQANARIFFGPDEDKDEDYSYPLHPGVARKLRVLLQRILGQQ